MKCLIVLFSVIALAWAQGGGNCHCGVFVTLRGQEAEVHRLDPINVQDCNDWNHCEQRCKDEFEALIINGGLEYVNSRTGLTYGQEACQIMDDNYGDANLDSHYIYGYAQVCTGPYQLIQSSRNGIDILCCVGGNYPGNCPTPQ